MSSDVIKTSPVAPPSIALALMAWKLAQTRLMFRPGTLLAPVNRAETDEYTHASNEYYHILRRIEDGETP